MENRKYLNKIFTNTGNIVVGAVLFVGYHAYDGVGLFVSSKYDSLRAILIMFCILFVLASALVYSHEFFKRKYAWDILELEELGNLKKQKGDKINFLKKITKKILEKGYWYIYFIGPILIGPHVVAIMLRKEKGLFENWLFILPGSILSAVFWVLFWKGFIFVFWYKIGYFLLGS